MRWYKLSQNEIDPSKISVGILPYREGLNGIEVILVQNHGSWNTGWEVPKGGIEEGESLEQAARREFEEELGIPATGNLIQLGKNWSGIPGEKLVVMFAMEVNEDPNTNSLNEDGIREIGAAQWIPIDQAMTGLSDKSYQFPFLDKLVLELGTEVEPGEYPEPNLDWEKMPERERKTYTDVVLEAHDWNTQIRLTHDFEELKK